MPQKVETSNEFSDVLDLKVKMSDGTFADIQRLVFTTSDGTLETVWERKPPPPPRPDPLILTVQTDINDKNDSTFILPVRIGNNPNWIVDWDDNQETPVTTAISRTHTYAKPGTYHIKIYPPSASSYKWLSSFGTARGKHLKEGGNPLNNQDWHGDAAISEPSIQNNLDKIVGVDGVITPQMVATEVEIAEGKVGDGVCNHWFYGCRNLTMSDRFTFSGWESITEVGGGFCYGMFFGCSGDHFTMGSAFNLPQHIARIGSNGASYLSPNWNQTPAYAFCNCMFYGCRGANFNMNSVFTLPQTLIMTGAWFCTSMFQGCSGNAFTMGAAFNLPQTVTKIQAPEIDSMHGHVCQSMFHGCSGSSFNMNSIFQLPQLLKHGQGNTFQSMFHGCRGASFTMNSIFNLPQAMTNTNYSFASSMFSGCKGHAFTMNSVFNAPPFMTNTPAYSRGFLSGLFYDCTGTAFQVNKVFTFPTLSQAKLDDTSGGLPFSNAFYNCTRPQTRTAASIIGSNPVPTVPRNTFGKATGFSDWDSIDANWRGDQK